MEELRAYFTWHDLLSLGLLGLGIIAVFIVGSFVLHKVRNHPDNFLRIFYRNLFHPIQGLLIVSGIFAVLKQLDSKWSENPLISHIYAISLVILVAWLALSLVRALGQFILRRFNIEVKDNLNARMVHTQIRIISRLAKAIIIILAIAAVLMTFEQIRSLGLSLLASAGMASIIIGFAAQKTIGNFFTGLQIAITQPIRLGDAVIVENEWGVIEEINLTYVVVRIWDLRRMVLPVSYFVDQPFQNWTRKTSKLIGAVILYFDYSMPIEPIRRELDHILEGTELWDGDVKNVQITNATEKTVQVRIIVSAADSGSTFNLRCLVREKILEFVQQNYPEQLPKFRAEVKDGHATTDASSKHAA